jgi:hypothetical protein
VIDTKPQANYYSQEAVACPKCAYKDVPFGGILFKASGKHLCSYDRCGYVSWRKRSCSMPPSFPEAGNWWGSPLKLKPENSPGHQQLRSWPGPPSPEYPRHCHGDKHGTGCMPGLTMRTKRRRGTVLLGSDVPGGTSDTERHYELQLESKRLKPRNWSHPPGSNRRPADYETEIRRLSCSVLVATGLFQPRLNVLLGGFWMGIWMGKRGLGDSARASKKISILLC